jgi:hypothetical protein
MLTVKPSKQSHPAPRRRMIACLALLAGGALFAADGNPDGWVVAVGKWTRRGQALQQYDAVFANDKLQGTSGTIVVALKDGQPPHPYHCDKFPCTVTIAGFRPVEDSLLARLGRAFGELASHRDTMPISAISRGREPLRQAVLAVDGGQLDLSDAVRSIEAGTYTVILRPIETAPSTGHEPLKGSVQWDPPAVTVASFPGLAPGIYELAMSSSEGDSLDSVAVLVASSADYPAWRKSFAAGVQSLPHDLDRVTLDAFLNALLFDIRAGSK